MELLIHYRQGGAAVLQRAVKVTPWQIKIPDQNLIAPVTEEKGSSVHKMLSKSHRVAVLCLIFGGLMIIDLSRTSVSRFERTAVFGGAAIINKMSRSKPTWNSEEECLTTENT